MLQKNQVQEDFIQIHLLTNKKLGIIKVNHQFQYCFINPNAESILGEKSSSLLGKRIWNHFLDFGRLLFVYYDQAFSAKETITFEVFSQKLNKFLDIKIYFEQQEGNNNCFIYVLEASELKSLQTQLSETQEILKAQYDSFPIPTYTWQKQKDDFVLINFNHKANQLNECHEEDILGIKLSLFHQNQIEVVENINNCFKYQKKINDEILYRVKTSGENRYLKITYVYIPDDLVMVHTEDITDIRLKEKEDNCLSNIHKECHAIAKFKDIIPIIIKNFCAFLDWDFGENWCPNLTKNILELKSIYDKNVQVINSEKDSDFKQISIEEKDGFLSKIYHSQLVEWKTNISDKFKQQESCYFTKKAQKIGAKAFLGIPLIAKNEVIAIFVFYSFNELKNEQVMINLAISIMNKLANLLERKKAEEERNQTQSRYSQIVQTSSEGIWLVDQTMKTIFVNEKMAEMIGYKVEDFQGKTVFDFMTKDIKNKSIYNLEKSSFVNQKPFENDVKFLHKNGSVIWGLLSFTSIYKSSGEYEGLLLMINDITRRKNAELSLHKFNQNLNNIVKQRTQKIQVQEQFFRAIFQQAAVGICLTTIGGEIFNCNQYFNDLVNSSLKKIRNKPFLEFVKKTHQKHFLKSLTELLTTNKNNVSCEIICIGENKKNQWINVNLSCLKNKLNQPHSILIIIENIEQRKQAQIQLQTSQEKYKTLFQILPVGVAVTDGEGNIIEVNIESENLLGISIENQLQKSLYDSDWAVIDSENLPIQASQLPGVKAILTQKNILNEEIGIVKQDGVVNWLCVNASPIPIKNYGAVIAYFDITERKQIEKWKDEFVSITTHELRTPLTSIKASLGLLSTGKLGKLDEKGENLLNIAYINTNRLEKIINDILQHQRLRFNKQIIQLKLCNTKEIEKGVINVIQPLVDKKEIQFSVSFDEFTVFVDKDYLIQLIINLTNNAIKFTEAGKKVNVKCWKQDNNMVCEIEDEGVGIPKDKLELIFNPFCQVDSSNSRQYEGTGLGLSICKSIVVAHRGKISVNSELGVGSKFSFTIPCMKKDEKSANY